MMKTNIIGNCNFCGRTIYEYTGHYTFLENIFCEKKCLYNKIYERAISLDRDTIRLLEDFIIVEQREIAVTESILSDDTNLSSFERSQRTYIIDSLTRIRNDSEGHIKALQDILPQLKEKLK